MYHFNYVNFLATACFVADDVAIPHFSEPLMKSKSPFTLTLRCSTCGTSEIRLRFDISTRSLNLRYRALRLLGSRLGTCHSNQPQINSLSKRCSHQTCIKSTSTSQKQLGRMTLFINVCWAEPLAAGVIAEIASENCLVKIQVTQHQIQRA